LFRAAMTVRTSGGNMDIPNDLFRTCLHYAEGVREFRELTDRGERLAEQIDAASAEILRLMIAADRHAIRVPTIPETILVRTEDDDLEVLHPASAFEVERLAEESQARTEPAAARRADTFKVGDRVEFQDRHGMTQRGRVAEVTIDGQRGIECENGYTAYLESNRIDIRPAPPEPDDDAIAEAAFNGAFHDVFGGALLDGEDE
jgi:hypothetical protein